MIRAERTAVVLPMLLSFGVLLSCGRPSARFPWSPEASERPSEHADVRTLNPGYSRLRSRVLVREVKRPTRAALDFAAYHQNFIISDPEPENLAADGREPDVKTPFEGAVDEATLTPDLGRTPLTEAERKQPFSLAPLLEFLAASKVSGADALEALSSAVREESWGLPTQPGVMTQTVSEVYLHEAAAGAAPELWLKIEFQPWFSGLGRLPDQDGDGFPEVYARAGATRLTPELIAAVRDDYAAKELGPEEVKSWANRLASYWYPSFNTDLVAPGATFPDTATEPEIKAELGDQVFEKPTIVMRAKPQGVPTYEVFLVRRAGSAESAAPASKAEEAPSLALPKTKPSPAAGELGPLLAAELAQNGGSYEAWAKALAPFHVRVRERLRKTPKAVKALEGSDGFLFFRQSLAFAASGDIERQRRGKNPLPVIVEFKRELEARGVDFLFVPVPTKVEVFPDRFDPAGKALVGKPIQPYARKFLSSLSAAGVEVVDLLPAYLAERSKEAGKEPLYQRQDTHWTDRGLQVAAELLAARVRKYPWYAAVKPHARRFTVKETAFERFGDLHSRLPEGAKKKYEPEKLRAEQVLAPGGGFYEDDEQSPIVVLGDSYTGVYQLMDAEHAGLSAHLARRVGYPADLVMSYGGGPNVRHKLLRRGKDALESKRLVIWVMTARDLYDYWEDWEPLKP
jgi:alginate O-acetyltransferase complex protein AlgJ